MRITKCQLEACLVCLFIQFRSSSSRCSEKNVLKNFAKFTRHHQCGNLRRLQVSRLPIKKRLRHRCFLSNSAKFLKATILWNYLIMSISLCLSYLIMLSANYAIMNKDFQINAQRNSSQCFTDDMWTICLYSSESKNTLNYF